MRRFLGRFTEPGSLFHMRSLADFIITTSVSRFSVHTTGIGILLLLYWQSKEGTPGPNRFGPNPLTAEKLKYREAD